MLIIRKSEKLLQRIIDAAKIPKYAEKICDMRTLLKYEKFSKMPNMRQSRFSDMTRYIVKLSAVTYAYETYQVF